MIIPVACVEQGRWRLESEAFAASPHVHFHAGRAAKLQTVSQALAAARDAHADQGQVWAHVTEKGDRLGVASPTAAMADFYTHLGPRVEAYVAAFAAQSDQVGAVFALGGRVVGWRCLTARRPSAKLLPKLIRSYALDAVEIPGITSPSHPRMPPRPSCGTWPLRL